jgi:hypothetical protein
VKQLDSNTRVRSFTSYSGRYRAMNTKDLHFINPRNLQLFENHGIDVIYPKKPCPKGLQALSEIIIQNEDESMGWPCMNDPWEWHKKDSKIDGSCRSGMYLYTSGHTELKIIIHDSPVYKYVVPMMLNPGTNLLSWCNETVLTHEHDFSSRFASKKPWFSMGMDNLGVARTYKLSHIPSGTTYTSQEGSAPMVYALKDQPIPPHLTVVSQKGVVPTLYLLAKIAGGWEGLMFENISGMAVDMMLGKVTYHSLENRLEKINKG